MYELNTLTYCPRNITKSKYLCSQCADFRIWI